MKVGNKCFSSKRKSQGLLVKILNPLRKHYSEGRAELHIGSTLAGYEKKVVPMEAFSRPLWGLVPFWAGGGKSEEFEDIYVKGLASGTTPDGNEYWGDVKNKDQRFVEMAAIAFGLLITPDKIWNPLTKIEKNNLANWLCEINNYEVPDSNWNLFVVIVNIALKKVGSKFSQEKIEHGLSRIESFYLGNGWYKDGHSNNKDYYVSFAIHFYCLIYAKLMESEDADRARIFKSRAMKFAHEFIYWFDENGSALPFGRSLAYRFAQSSFWGACLFADVHPFSVGVMKGLITRNLLEWLNSDIFDKSGILTIGYKYPNMHMAEGYNASGSAYWSLKAFIFLSLADGHEFWSCAEEPLPKLENIKTLKNADMVIQRKLNDVVAYVPGRYTGRLQVHDPSKYSKFSYSTQFGFSVPRTNHSIQEAAPDSMLAFDINGYIFVRKNCTSFKIDDNEVFSAWSPFNGIAVETTIIPTNIGHVRRHKITCEYDCVAYDCGYSVAITEDGSFKELTSRKESCVGNNFSYCKVISMDGNGKGQVIDAEPNTNLIHPKTKIPAIRHELRQGVNLIETAIISQADFTEIVNS